MLAIADPLFGSVVEQHVEDVVALLAAGLGAGAVKEAWCSAAGAMPYPLTTQAPGWTPLATKGIAREVTGRGRFRAYTV